MPANTAIVLELPPGRPETYLELVKICRLGLRRNLGVVTAEELGAGARWDIVNQAVTAYLQGHREVTPRVAVGPDVAELLRDHVLSGPDLPADLGTGRPVGPGVAELAARCVEGLRRQLVPARTSA